MASIKDLKKRIGSVKNTQQTTRAMKMVSAAKLRRAQEAIQSHRPYARRMGHLIQLVSQHADGEIVSPLIRKQEGAVDGDQKKRALLIIVSSDRGLCGGFNSNVIKAGQRWLLENSDRYSRVQVGFVGKKAYDIYKNRKVNLGPYWSDLGGKVTFAKAKTLSDAIVNLYLTGEVDEVKFVYNEFKNAVTQKTVVEDFLPLSPVETSEKVASKSADQASEMYLFKPSQKELLELLLAKNFAIQSFRILLESQASEHGSRMSSMESATKNAGEMIRKLTLQYNKQRQAGITKELLEIISGSESQKSSA